MLLCQIYKYRCALDDVFHRWVDGSALHLHILKWFGLAVIDSGACEHISLIGGSRLPVAVSASK